MCFLLAIKADYAIIMIFTCRSSWGGWKKGSARKKFCQKTDKGIGEKSIRKGNGNSHEFSFKVKFSNKKFYCDLKFIFDNHNDQQIKFKEILRIHRNHTPNWKHNCAVYKESEGMWRTHNFESGGDVRAHELWMVYALNFLSECHVRKQRGEIFLACWGIESGGVESDRIFLKEGMKFKRKVGKMISKIFIHVLAKIFKIFFYFHGLKNLFKKFFGKFI